MKNAATMGFAQRCRDLNRQALGFFNGKTTAQRTAVDVLHHQIVRPDIVKLTNVRMVQGGDGLRFLHESLAVFGIQPFECNNSVQSRVSRLPDFAHTTGANWRDQRVRPELCPS